MSKHETPLTRRYWKEETGGTLIEEFPAVRRSLDRSRRLIDAVVILGGPHVIGKADEVEIKNRDIVIIQTKAPYTLGMYLLGQALFSRHLMERFQPKSIESVAICTKGDAVMEGLAERYGIKVVVYPPNPAKV